VKVPVSIAVVGAGNRGQTYADLASADGRARVVAVADPDPSKRIPLAERHGVPIEQRHEHWQSLLDGPRIADAVVIATQDRLHYAPAMALLEQGYHLLLEKPMATTLSQCDDIVAAAERSGATLAIGHVLRYTPYTQALRRLIGAGAIGDLVTIEHLEPVGWWHFAHSFVRGNWRRTDESSFMLLTKCVHDIDWLGHVVGRPARRVSSFGGLYHFRAEQRPEGAAERCVDCELQDTCAYSAIRIYLPCLGDPDTERWPLQTVTSERTADGVRDALRVSPYGRCVYGCDNDVVDHQVVSIEYEGGVTASFTATAFTGYEFRKTRFFGTQGSIEGDGAALDVLDFRTARRERTEITSRTGTDGQSGHGGGDAGLVRAFLDALASDEPGAHLPDPREALAAHHLTWAAERARLNGSVVDLTEADLSPDLASPTSGGTAAPRPHHP
jgi:predicted dehydrogenase